jgi:hypothetical protein
MLRCNLFLVKSQKVALELDTIKKECTYSALALELH